MLTMATSAVGTTTLDPLMFELRTKLWTKQAKELENARLCAQTSRCKKHMRNTISLKACSGIREIL